MKIDRPNAGNIAGAYRAGSARPATATTATGAAKSAAPDQVNVSDKARQAAALKSKLKEAPEVRMDLVERIKAQIEAGKYNVDPMQVAEKLLKSKVLDE